MQIILEQNSDVHKFVLWLTQIIINTWPYAYYAEWTGMPKVTTVLIY